MLMNIFNKRQFAVTPNKQLIDRQILLLFYRKSTQKTNSYWFFREYSKVKEGCMHISAKISHLGWVFLWRQLTEKSISQDTLWIFRHMLPQQHQHWCTTTTTPTLICYHNYTNVDIPPQLHQCWCTYLLCFSYSCTTSL